MEKIEKDTLKVFLKDMKTLLKGTETSPLPTIDELEKKMDWLRCSIMLLIATLRVLIKE